jgi:hypothetical protein
MAQNGSKSVPALSLDMFFPIRYIPIKEIASLVFAFRVEGVLKPQGRYEMRETAGSISERGVEPFFSEATQSKAADFSAATAPFDPGGVNHGILV